MTHPMFSRLGTNERMEDMFDHRPALGGLGGVDFCCFLRMDFSEGALAGAKLGGTSCGVGIAT